jgi:hypothetical protein
VSHTNIPECMKSQSAFWIGVWSPSDGHVKGRGLGLRSFPKGKGAKMSAQRFSL